MQTRISTKIATRKKDVSVSIFLFLATNILFLRFQELKMSKYSQMITFYSKEKILMM